MFSDGILPLVKKGVVTNAKKTEHVGKMVSSFLVGTRDLYDFVHDNPMVEMLQISNTNDTRTICK
jgi:4-hydroxybutyrate CoA-transferase